MNEDHIKQSLRWLLTGSKGLSSKYMLAIALGEEDGVEYFHPLDCSDFVRCHHMLEMCPFVRDAFPKIAAQSLEWQKLIEAWPQLTKLVGEAKSGVEYVKASNLIDKLLNPKQK